MTILQEVLKDNNIFKEKLSNCKYCNTEPVLESFNILNIKKYRWSYPCRCWEKELQRQEEQKKKEQKEIQYLKNGVPLRFKDVCFKNTIISEINQEIYQKSLDWTELFLEKQTNGKGLFFFGPFGIGKTHLVFCITHKIHFESDYNYFFNFYSTPTLLEKTRCSFNFENIVNPITTLIECNPQLLILDDLGKEKSSEWVKEQLYILINHRYENLLPIIFTSNCNEKDLSKNLGEAIISRIYEMCDIYTFKGIDRRKIKL